jgi:acetyltransferase-like isoleucine patch superfamily enzyme
MTKPIVIGDYSYVGSEIRIVPGGEIPPKCIVGIGAIITKKFEDEYKLIAGVPAKNVKDLDEEGKFLTEYKTRPDLPDEI